jgi:hypothetical protein
MLPKVLASPSVIENLQNIIPHPVGMFLFAGARNVLSIPFHCHVVWILEYLESLVTADLKHNTQFVSHISALSSCLPLYDGIAIGNHPLIYMVDPWSQSR